MGIIARGTQAVAHAFHVIAGVLILATMLMTVVDVLGRATIAAPLQGSVELTSLAMVAIVYLGLAHAHHKGDHIKVDLLYQRAGRRLRRAMDVVADAITVLVLAAMAWQLVQYWDVLSAGGRSTGVLGVPLAPLAWVAVAGTLVYLLGATVTAVQGSDPPMPATSRGDDGGSVSSSGQEG